VVAVPKAVQVQKVVAAFMVVAAAAFAVAFVPEFLKPPHGFWFSGVNLFHQGGVHLLAESHPFMLNLQGLIKKVVLAGDDIDEVPNAPGRMIRAVQVNVYPAGGVGKGSGFA
jgi:hypothetical protein